MIDNINSFDFEGSEDKLNQIKPILMEMRDAEVRKFNLAVPTAVAMGMRVYKSYMEDRGRFSAMLTREAFNPEEYANFPIRVGALWHADNMLRQAVDPRGSIVGLIEEAKLLHSKLSRAASYLWGADEELGPIISSIREGGGHMDKADDLSRYSALFTENWAAAAGKCDVTQEDLAKARKISAKVLDALTAVPASDVAELRRLRDRAGEYLLRAVGDIRDAAAYIFRKSSESLERYPSMYEKRSTKKTQAPAQPKPAQTTV